jgi:hypothetical protein
MNEVLNLAEMSVADLLKSTPSISRLFIEQRTACVGCNLARFCNLEDVIKTYSLDEAKFLEAISKYIVQKS